VQPALLPSSPLPSLPPVALLPEIL
jgi:hypothetical protein